MTTLGGEVDLERIEKGSAVGSGGADLSSVRARVRNHGRDENRDESHENALGKAYTGRTGWATKVGVTDFAGENRKTGNSSVSQASPILCPKGSVSGTQKWVADPKMGERRRTISRAESSRG